MTAPSPRYRLLALSTVVATFLLIVLGGIVRVSDSGLGCGKAHSGVHGWPLCRGDVVPGVSLHAVIEYCHRFVAAVVVLLMAALAVQAWRRYRGYRAIVVASTVGTVLIIAQALLGAATVDQDLNETLVASHLGLAMLLFAITIFILRAVQPGVAGAPPPDARPGLPPPPGPAPAAPVVGVLGRGPQGGTPAAASGRSRSCHRPSCSWRSWPAATWRELSTSGAPARSGSARTRRAARSSRAAPTPASCPSATRAS